MLVSFRELSSLLQCLVPGVSPIGTGLILVISAWIPSCELQFHKSGIVVPSWCLKPDFLGSIPGTFHDPTGDSVVAPLNDILENPRMTAFTQKSKSKNEARRTKLQAGGFNSKDRIELVLIRP